MRTVIRPLVPTMEYGLRLIIKRIPYSFFLIAFFATSISSIGQGVSCYSSVNVSINNGYPTRLSIGSLTPRTNTAGIFILLNDQPTDTLMSLEFTCDDVGKTIMATLVDGDNQRCMVSINVEDKSPLMITCRDTMLTCLADLNDTSLTSLIEVASSCDDLSDASVIWEDAIPVDFPITSDTFQLIERTWSVTGADANVTNCTSKIYTRRFDLSLVEFPKDTSIYCGQDHTDIMITGAPNFSNDLLVPRCGVSIGSSPIMESLKGACLDKSKYKRVWSVTDWNTNEIIQDTQLIIVIDTIPASLDAPDSLEVVSAGDCMFGIVLSAPALSLSCTEVLLQDIVVFVDGLEKNIGDTAFVGPGTHNIKYSGRSLCQDVVMPDSLVVTVLDTGVPVLDCSDLNDLSLTLKDGASIWINIDSVFQGINISGCMGSKILGRKVVDTCDMDTREFVSIMEFCPAELRSGLTPSTIQVEIVAQGSNDSLSNICVINIEVKETVAPVIVPNDDPIILSIGPGGELTIDTSDILMTWSDNANCFSSISMTGSGIGFASMTGSGTGLAWTGSGIAFLGTTMNQTLSCEDTGRYEVVIVATDCDANESAPITTTITVDDGGNCGSNFTPNVVSGLILANTEIPFSDVAVLLETDSDDLYSNSGLDGSFTFRDVSSSDGTLNISHSDSWLRGLSVIDLKLVQDYILGNRELEDWQKAASDMDRSGRVTALDLLFIRRLILGHDVDMGDAMPWIFTVEDGMESYQDYFSKSIGYQETVYISAAKRGDVSGDALQSASNRSVTRIPISVNSLSKTTSIFTIDLNRFSHEASFQMSLEIKGGTIDQLDGPTGIASIEGNRVDILRYQKAEENLSLINIKISHTAGIKPELTLGDNLQPLFYDEYSVASDISVDVTEDKRIFASTDFNLKASPNPTSEYTTLDVISLGSDDSDIFVGLYDVQGRSIYQDTWMQSKVADIFPLKLPELPNAGLYFAQVRINGKVSHIYIVKN